MSGTTRVISESAVGGESKLAKSPVAIFGVVIAASLSMIQYSFMLSTVNVGIVQIQESLNAGITFTSWLFLGGQMFSVLVALTAGRLGDAYGRRRVLLVLYAFSAFGAVLAIFAGGPVLLVIALTAQGAALASPSLASAIIQQQVTPKHVPVAIGWQYGTQSLGTLGGALIGGTLLVHFSFHVLFIVPAALSLLGLALTATITKNETELTRQRPDWISSSFLTVGFFALILALSQVTTWGVFSALFSLCVIVGIVGFVGYWMVSRRSANPIIPIAALRVRSVWMSVLLITIFSVAVIFDFYMLPYFLANPAESGRGFGWTSDAIGVVVAVAAIGGVLGAPLSGLVTRRLGSGKSMAIGFALAGTSQIVMAFVNFPADFIYVVQVCAGLGSGWAFASVMNAVVEGASISVPHLLATIVSVSVIMQTVGNSIGIAASAAIVSSSITPEGVLPPATFKLIFSIAAGFYLMGFIVALLVRRARLVTGQLLPEADAESSLVDHP